jgi:hypothetical protein
VFTRTRSRRLTWARLIQSTSPTLFCNTPVTTWFRLRLGLPNGIFYSGLQTEISYTFHIHFQVYSLIKSVTWDAKSGAPDCAVFTFLKSKYYPWQTALEHTQLMKYKAVTSSASMISCNIRLCLASLCILLCVKQIPLFWNTHYNIPMHWVTDRQASCRHYTLVSTRNLPGNVLNLTCALCPYLDIAY